MWLRTFFSVKWLSITRGMVYKGHREMTRPHWDFVESAAFAARARRSTWPLDVEKQGRRNGRTVAAAALCMFDAAVAARTHAHVVIDLKLIKHRRTPRAKLRGRFRARTAHVGGI